MPMATSSSSLPRLSLPPTKPTSRKLRGSHFRVASRSSVGETLHKKDLAVNLLNHNELVKVKEGDDIGLVPLYDDGYGSRSVNDYLDAAREIIKTDDSGPPRWLCPVECGQPISGAPVLMFLPDIDGTGMGLILHHKSLGKVFEVRCLHIPMSDRTPFEGLVKFVEQSVKHEHALSPKRPIYLLGDSFGGCLALAVAARNPSIDLVLVLVNPATSFNKSKLQPFIPALEALPRDFPTGILSALTLLIGGPFKTAMANIVEDLPQQMLNELSNSLSSFLQFLSDITVTLQKDTFLWKLKLLKSGSSYSSSRLHAVEAQVLVLASGNDNLLPSGDEAECLWTTLKNCKVRYFKDSDHALLLEDSLNLLTVIKATCTYRHSRQHDYVSDCLPLTISEFRKILVQDFRLLNLATSPVFLSTLENGRIVRGLSGVPNNGPILFVGYHMLMGIEVFSIVEEFVREKNILVRSLAHPFMATKAETSRQEFALFDTIAVLGALPVSARNIYKLLSRKSFVVLYPGGIRESYHRKGEEYKLFWPDQPEFVRMAARFGATIVPFGTVGIDDIAELVLDYNDQMKIPFLKKWIEKHNEEEVRARLRADMDGEISKQDMHYPIVAPKVPGRFYYLFGRPYETRGMDPKDRESAIEMYSQIKSDVECLIAYLRKKREEDPYRSIVQRTIYQLSRGGSAAASEIPTFEP
ncbi:putative acyltransferase-like protein, chloroplastic [Iris pallida]|uniref:Acyltransferase-like protein, chloroplastic n=1 Tax=Iris pallida TaxID=29817 RepID=A0AAX6DWQ8_IRIPA|nr:putative acyltransferase-like protein, chloroplastic [Iris pallida]